MAIAPVLSWMWRVWFLSLNETTPLIVVSVPFTSSLALLIEVTPSISSASIWVNLTSSKVRFPTFFVYSKFMFVVSTGIFLIVIFVTVAYEANSAASNTFSKITSPLPLKHFTKNCDVESALIPWLFK